MFTGETGLSNLEPGATPTLTHAPSAGQRAEIIRELQKLNEKIEARSAAARFLDFRDR